MAAIGSDEPGMARHSTTWMTRRWRGRGV